MGEVTSLIQVLSELWRKGDGGFAVVVLVVFGLLMLMAISYVVTAGMSIFDRIKKKDIAVELSVDRRENSSQLALVNTLEKLVENITTSSEASQIMINKVSEKQDNQHLVLTEILRDNHMAINETMKELADAISSSKKLGKDEFKLLAPIVYGRAITNAAISVISRIDENNLINNIEQIYSEIETYVVNEFEHGDNWMISLRFYDEVMHAYISGIHAIRDSLVDELKETLGKTVEELKQYENENNGIEHLSDGCEGNVAGTDCIRIKGTVEKVINLMTKKDRIYDVCKRSVRTASNKRETSIREFMMKI